MTEPKAPYAQPVTGVYAVAWWEPGSMNAPAIGVLSSMRRMSDVYRVTFNTESEKAAFPEAVLAFLDANGCELIFCEELPARYK